MQTALSSHSRTPDVSICLCTVVKKNPSAHHLALENLHIFWWALAEEDLHFRIIKIQLHLDQCVLLSCICSPSLRVCTWTAPALLPRWQHYASVSSSPLGTCGETEDTSRYPLITNMAFYHTATIVVGVWSLHGVQYGATQLRFGVFHVRQGETRYPAQAVALVLPGYGGLAEIDLLVHRW